eukprot:1075859-Rhodomonas_salina.2
MHGEASSFRLLVVPERFRDGRVCDRGPTIDPEVGVRAHARPGHAIRVCQPAVRGQDTRRARDTAPGHVVVRNVLRVSLYARHR